MSNVVEEEGYDLSVNQAVSQLISEYSSPAQAKEYVNSVILRNPTLATTTQDAVSARFYQHCKLSNAKPSISLHHLASGDLVEKLQRAFPEIRMRVAATHDAIGHAFARQSREVEYYYIYNILIKYSNDVNLMNTLDGERYDMFVKDVGADPTRHIKEQRLKVHCCNPILNIKDVGRFHSSSDYMCCSAARIQLKSRSAASAVANILSGDKLSKCNRRAEHCGVTAPFLTFIHSTYDIGLDDFVRILDKSKCREAFVVMLFHPNVSVMDYGELPGMDCSFERYITQHGKRRIRFVFNHDSSLSYDHDWDTYFALVRCNYLQCADAGSRYVLDHFRTKNSTVFIRIYKEVRSVAQRESLFRIIPFDDDEPKVVIHTWKYNALAIDQDHLEPLRIVVPKHLYERIMGYAIMCPAGKFTTAGIMQAANAFNSRTALAGISLSLKEPVDVETLSYLVTAIYVKVFILNFANGKTVQCLLEEEDTVRTWFTSGLITKLFRKKPVSRGCSALEQSVFVKYQEVAITESEWQRVDPWWTRFKNFFISIMNEAADRPHDVLVYHGARVLTFEEEMPGFSINAPVYTKPFMVLPTADTLICKATSDMVIKNSFVKTEDKDIKIPNLSMQLETVEQECSDKFTLISVPGDNDCFYHAINVAFDRDMMTPDMIKARLICSDYLTAFDSKVRDEVMNVLRSEGVDSWATNEVILLTAYEFGVNIRVHINVEARNDYFVSNGYYSFNPDSSVVLNVKYDANHFDALKLYSELSSEPFVYLGPEDLGNACEAAQHLTHNEVLKMQGVTEVKLSMAAASMKYNHLCYTKWFGYNGGYALLLDSAYRNKDLVGKRVLDVHNTNGSSVQYFCDGKHAMTTGAGSKRGDFDTMNAWVPLVLPARPVGNELWCKSLPSDYDVVNINPIGYTDGIATLDEKAFSEAIMLNFGLVRSLRPGGVLSLVFPYSFPTVVRAIISASIGKFMSVAIYKSVLLPDHTPWLLLLCDGAKDTGDNIFSSDNLCYRPSVNVEDWADLVNESVRMDVEKSCLDIMSFLQNPKCDGIAAHDYANLCKGVTRRSVRKFVGGASEPFETGVNFVRKVLGCVPTKRSDEDLKKLNDASVVHILKTLGVKYGVPLRTSKDMDNFPYKLLDDDEKKFISILRENFTEFGETFAMKSIKWSKFLKRKIWDLADLIKTVIAEERILDEPIDTVVVDDSLFVDKMNKMPRINDVCFSKPKLSGMKSEQVVNNCFDITDGGILPVSDIAKRKGKGTTLHTFEGWSFDDTKWMQRCVTEYLHCLKLIVDVVRDECVRCVNVIQTQPENIWVNVLVGFENLVVIRNGIVIFGSKVNIGRYVYGEDFSLVEDIKLFPSTGLYISYEKMRVFTDLDLYRRYSGYQIVKCLPKGAGLVQAAAGCGKTTSILHSVKSLADKPYLVLTSTSEGCGDVIDRLCKLTNTETRHLKSNVKTVDSFLMHSDTVTVEALFIDEALMQHAGKLLLAIDKVETHYVRAYGDRLQIPFVSRAPKYVCEYAEADKIFPIVDVLSISHRVPADITAILHPQYKEQNLLVGYDVGMRSYNVDNIPSYQVFREGNLNNFPPRPKVKYICYLQSDKEVLTKLRYNPSTVHEYQGKEADDVVLIRLSNFKEEVFDKPNYATTAITRHKRSFTYVTLGPDDILTNWLSIRRNRGDRDVVAATVIRGGAMDTLMSSVSSVLIDALPRNVNHCPYVSAPKSSVVISESDDGLISISKEHIRIPSLITKSELKNRLSPSIVHKSVAIPTNHFKNMDNVVATKVFKDLGYDVIRTGNRDALISTEVFSAGTKSGLEILPSKSLMPVADIVLDVEDIYLNVITPDNAILQVQMMIDNLLPGTTYVDKSLDAHMFHTMDFATDVGDVKFTDQLLPYPVQSFDCKRPLLNTAVPYTQRNTTRHLLHAFSKRNANPPRLMSFVSVNKGADEMLKLLKTCCPNACVDGIDASIEAMHEWVIKQDTAVLGRIDPPESLFQIPLDGYEIIVKSTPKPDLTVKCNDTYEAPQTILFQEKYVNAIFCVIWGEIRDRVMAGLKPNLLVYTQMTEDMFASKLTAVLPPEDLSRLYSYEVDMKKYDKSQTELVLEFEAKVMRMFGVPEYWVTLWCNGHRKAYVFSRQTGLRLGTTFQRKSGDASTFFGNTLLLMTILTELFGDHLHVGVFAGDDSVIWTKTEPRLNLDMLAHVYNLEAKIFRYRFAHFCSKFLVPMEGRWYVVPDPLKRAVRLGRHDLRNDDHVEVYRLSFADNVRLYRNHVLAQLVSEALQERYESDYDCTIAVLSLAQLSQKGWFDQLYMSLPGDKLLKDLPSNFEI